MRATATTQKAVADHMEKIDQALKFAEPQIRPARQAIRDGMARNFELEAAAEVGRWADLADSTVAERLAQGFPGEHPILVRTGDYRASFVNPGHAEHVSARSVESGKIKIEEGSSDERAGVLEEGSIFVPARPVTGLGPVGTRELQEALDQSLDQRLPAN